MAAIQKRQGKGGISYRVQIRLKGHPPEAATFDRLTDAKRWAAETETAIKAGRHFGIARRRSFDELADAYLEHIKGRLTSAPGVEGQLDRWREEFKGLRLDEIKPRLIATKRDKLTNEELPSGKQRTAATVNRYLAALSSCFTFAVREMEWIESNPVRRVTKGREAEGRIRFLSDDELKRLLKACEDSTNTNLYVAVVLALTTGARQNEILSARWPQVDFERRTIRLAASDTKTKQARILPLAGVAWDLLKARSKVRDLNDDRVFPVPAEGRAFGSLRTAWLKALERAEVQDFRWHDLRHTAASYLAMSGVSSLEIAKILGHRTLEMTMRYSHLATERTVELGDMLSDRLGLKGNTA